MIFKLPLVGSFFVFFTFLRISDIIALYFIGRRALWTV